MSSFNDKRRFLSSDPEFLLNYMDALDSEESDDDFDGYVDNMEIITNGEINSSFQNYSGAPYTPYTTTVPAISSLPCITTSTSSTSTTTCPANTYFPYSNTTSPATVYFPFTSTATTYFPLTSPATTYLPSTYTATYFSITTTTTSTTTSTIPVTTCLPCITTIPAIHGYTNNQTTSSSPHVLSHSYATSYISTTSIITAC